MFLMKWLRPRVDEETTPALSESVENAILLGGVSELDEALGRAERDAAFPEDLRYGLEALRYFRAHYGPGQSLEPAAPLQKQKAIITEMAWGAELLEKLRRHEAANDTHSRDMT